MENKKKWKVPFALKKDQLLILLLSGVLLLVIALPSGTGKRESQKGQEGTSDSNISGNQTGDDYVTYMERHLEKALSQMAGVGDAVVVITLKASAEKVVEKDVEVNNETMTESDSQGGNRTTQNAVHGETTIYGGEDQQKQAPYVSKEISPQVEGVVVLASGGDNAVVVKNITEAVQALFTIDTHKIKIMKKN